MADLLKRYMTVSIDIQPQGLNLSCWMNTEPFWKQEVITYPHVYTYMGDRCTWFIHANSELTAKLVTSIGEQADRICAQQFSKNSTRKLANR
jgi:hypothetical protein